MANASQKPKTKRQLDQEALQASLESRWEEALRINDEFLSRFPRSAEALNRKGRAYIELRRLNEARDAYTEALKADPANMIARRNLQRLETLYNRTDGLADVETPSNSIIPRASVFIQEAGKTWLDELANAADRAQLAAVSPGDKVELRITEDGVELYSKDGVRLGEIEPTIASRMARLAANGHAFEAYALGTTPQSFRVIIRETARPENSESVLTFPRQDFASQDLMREREQLSMLEESDFDFGDDEDDPAAKHDEDLDDADELEEDASEYVDDTVVPDDEEEPEM